MEGLRGSTPATEGLRGPTSAMGPPWTYLGDGRLAQVGLEDGDPGSVVGQRDVDELVQTPRTQDGRIDNVCRTGKTGDVRQNELKRLSRYYV